jgi:hypothetical protein
MSCEISSVGSWAERLTSAAHISASVTFGLSARSPTKELRGQIKTNVQRLTTSQTTGLAP